MRELYIGLMSGTSADGIDAAIVDFSQTFPSIVNTHYIPYLPHLKEKIVSLCYPGENEIQRLGELDKELGKEFARAVENILKKESISAQHIKAIGCHGQTIRHSPNSLLGFTLQIGDPNTIAAETGITTVADFRRKDMAHGGQGAPLVPAFHQHVFTDKNIHRAIVNIGGISNITLLPKNNPDPILGFDTGPGNILLDEWINLHHQKNHDENGSWAEQGKTQTDLLNNMLTDAYFNLSPPKSSGREYFNLEWLNKFLQINHKEYSPVDVQATLVDLTAYCIIDSIRHYLSSGEILICGGGVHNSYLMKRLHELAQPNFTVVSTQKYGLAPDWIEAVAFAWLARQTINKLPGNLPSVTGANRETVLGGIYYN